MRARSAAVWMACMRQHSTAQHGAAQHGTAGHQHGLGQASQMLDTVCSSCTHKQSVLMCVRLLCMLVCAAAAVYSGADRIHDHMLQSNGWCPGVCFSKQLQLCLAEAAQDAGSARTCLLPSLRYGLVSRMVSRICEHTAAAELWHSQQMHTPRLSFASVLLAAPKLI
jgi:hypothetical protein